MPTPLSPSPVSNTNSRYPSTLNRSGPSRPSRPNLKSKQSKQSIKQHQQHQQSINTRKIQSQSPSIDSEYHPPPPPLPLNPPPLRLHEFSSLADLLQKAGYKETRIYTPESKPKPIAPRRTIRQTLEDDQDEISDLYGTFGIPRPHPSSLGSEHRVEAIQPLENSRTLLRNLASASQGQGGMDMGSEEGGWWMGGVAALGRAAKAVIDISPPNKGGEVGNVGLGLGLGLGKGGEGVRRAKSNWEMRSGGLETRDQEEIPPIPNYIASDPTLAVELVQVKVASPPPPKMVDEDAFGYSPLPDDYEAECEDDEMYAIGGFTDIDSLGSGSAGSSRSESSSERRVDMVMGISADLEQGSLRERIMQGAVDYDDFDSPDRHTLVLPLVEGDGDTTPTPSPKRPQPARSRTTPSPSPEPEVVIPTIKKPLKYADRSLRLAQSTPAFSKTTDTTWLGSIRTALLAKSGYAPIPPVPVPGPSTSTAPIRISAAKPAAPTLVITSPVICDSTSTEAADLPLLPCITISPPKSAMSSIALRLRPSLAALRVAVGLPEAKIDGGDTPTLSPRLDWSASGERLVEKGKVRNPLPWGQQALIRDERVEETSALGLGSEESEIDYTRSFFYKPPTPPHPSSAAARASASAAIVDPTPDSSSGQIAKRQRSIKSLRAALLLPVAPPVPAIPSQYLSATPPGSTTPSIPQPPILAITSPGAWEAGLPPRELVLEGEEWDARDGGQVGEWGRRGKKGKKGLRKKKSKDGVRV